MRFLRLVSPRYVLRLESEVADLSGRLLKVSALVDQLAADPAATAMPPAMLTSMRDCLLTITDAMASGRIGDAKVMVDGMLLILSQEGL